MFSICQKIRQRVSQAKLQGYQSIICDRLSEDEQNELKECGFYVKVESGEEGKYWIVSE